jgi:transposase
VGHSILTIAYTLLKRPDTTYQDLGVRYFDDRDRQVVERRLVRRLQGLGYRVTLEPAAA